MKRKWKRMSAGRWLRMRHIRSKFGLWVIYHLVIGDCRECKVAFTPH